MLTSYREFKQYVGAFAEGHLNLLILTGGPGLGKSQILKSAVGGDACWFDGRTTAFGMYVRLYEHRNQPIVIDDVDDLHRDRDAIRLLKALCQTDRDKAISWNSASRQLDQLEIPRHFRTTSKTAIVANDWQRLNLDLEALEDRGHVVHFAPSALEVQRQAAAWFDDQEVFDFIGTRLSLLERPSFRHYVAAAELRRAGLDWKGAMLARCLSGKQLIVAQLKADARFASEEERGQAFVAAEHGCRATYYNIAKKLPKQIEPPQLTLKTAEQPEATLMDIIELLKRRHGELGNG